MRTTSDKLLFLNCVIAILARSELADEHEHGRPGKPKQKAYPPPSVKASKEE